MYLKVLITKETILWPVNNKTIQYLLETQCCFQQQVLVDLLCLPSEMRGHIVLQISVGMSVGRSVGRHFASGHYLENPWTHLGFKTFFKLDV